MTAKQVASEPSAADLKAIREAEEALELEKAKHAEEMEKADLKAIRECLKEVENELDQGKTFYQKHLTKF